MDEVKCPFCGLYPFEDVGGGKMAVTCCRKGDLTIAHGFTVDEANAIVDHGIPPAKVLRMRNVVKALHDAAKGGE